MQVVKEQITRALTIKPNSLDQFKSRLQNLSYTEILKLRQSERMNQEDFQSRPILWVTGNSSIIWNTHFPQSDSLSFGPCALHLCPTHDWKQAFKCNSLWNCNGNEDKISS